MRTGAWNRSARCTIGDATRAIRAALEAGVRKVTDALRRLESDGFAIRYLRVENEAPFANLNTPDEMQRYLNG